MSAIVCRKRNLFEELPVTPPISKRPRCSSPIRFYSYPSSLDQIRLIFPHMDLQILERVLEECDYNIDSAIKSLHELQLISGEGNLDLAEESNDNSKKGELSADVEAASTESPSVLNSLAVNGAEWVELLVREMSSATSMDDARARAANVLENLEKSISARAGAELAQSVNKDNLMLKEQMQVLIRDNTLLKRAVAIQHERQKEHEDRNQELQNLKQMVSQYQERLRSLEVSNYTLMMHLKQAQQGTAFPGRFHPDVF